MGLSIKINICGTQWTPSMCRTYNIYFNIFNLGLPNKGDQVTQWDPCIKTCLQYQVVQDIRCNLSNNVKVLTSKRACILYECARTKLLSNLKTRDIEQVQACLEQLLFGGIRSKLVVNHIMPKVLNKHKENSMQYFNRGVSMGINTWWLCI